MNNTNKPDKSKAQRIGIPVGRCHIALIWRITHRIAVSYRIIKNTAIRRIAGFSRINNFSCWYGGWIYPKRFSW